MERCFVFWLAVALSGAGALGDECPFSVRWNGSDLALQPARISAVPFNRVWSGRQRSVSQTKIAYFVPFPVASPGVLEVGIRGDNYHVLPLTFAKHVTRTGNVLKVSVDGPRQFVIEADGTALHLFADPPFVHKPVPNEIYFGPGVHEAGVIEPKSGQTVCLDAGAVVYGNILVHHVENVKIVGRGILDTSRLIRADHESEAFRRAVAAGMSPDQYGAEMAVNPLTIYASTNVTVEGIVFRDSPRWTVIVRNGSKNISVDNIKIIGMWRYNSDGINFCASEDCSIRRSFIRTFDDCIVARGPYLDKETQDCRRILAEDCVLWCDWGKNLEVWAGHIPGTIADVVYRRCQLVNVSWMACDVTTRYGSPATRIKNVTVEDLEINYAKTPIAERIQKTDDDVYGGVPQERQCLVRVDCGPVGRNTGNQGIEEGVGTENISVRYDNLVFRRFTVLGDAYRDLTYTILTETKPHYRATNVVVEDVPGRAVED